MNYIFQIMKSEMFITVISGVIVFIISQCVIDFIINPHKEFLSLKERIAYALAMYCCYYHSPYNFNKKENVRAKEEYDEASKELRKIGSELAGYIGKVSKIRFIKRKKLKDVKSALIGLSNGLYIYTSYSPIKDNIDAEKIIKMNLGIKEL